MFGRGRDPTWERAGFSQFVDVAQQLHPDVLAHVLGVGRCQSMPSANCVDERLVPADELLPCFLVRFRGSFDKGCV
jgi:hypothetical protein